MIFAAVGHSFLYETEKLARAFFPFVKFNFSNSLPENEDGILTVIESNEAVASLRINGTVYTEKIACPAEFEDKDKELILSTALYNVLCRFAGYKQPWGVLTGVRPAKLFSRLMQTEGRSEAERYFTEKLLVDPKKISLCAACAESERSIVERSKPNSFSLYVSIPFCPSRCNYCSFVSHSVDKAAALIPQYLELLLEELRTTAKISKELGLTLSTVYIGGGTPSILTPVQIKKMLSVIIENFDLSSCLEFTFEAGRPETITADKLKALLDFGVSRISINPQSFHNKTLEAIGRKHTVEDVYEAYNTAVACGVKHINMDLIAGLAYEQPSDFSESLKSALSLKPQSITVHTLSMKRASNLSKNNDFSYFEQGIAVKDMVDYAKSSLAAEGYSPYYMYRQSKTIGNLENVGYSKQGFEGLYNVYIMDETHTILACGASAVTKLKVPGKNIIERVSNFKYPYEYINRFSEILSRKDEIKQFYKKHYII